MGFRSAPPAIRIPGTADPEIWIRSEAGEVTEATGSQRRNESFPSFLRCETVISATSDVYLSFSHASCITLTGFVIVLPLTDNVTM